MYVFMAEFNLERELFGVFEQKKRGKYKAGVFTGWKVKKILSATKLQLDFYSKNAELLWVIGNISVQLF
jgi:hypothetical protein